ncbi:hypothetical protein [Streptomyces sp. NPDC060198]|uniref:hypothetical protein n=1 Tax=Streptomyces sp. NPDC060198 TaxID=3347070 RepID=UPI00364B03FC
MDRWDVLALIGVVGIGVGLGLLAPWLGIAVAGTVLLALGLTGAAIAERAARTAELIEARKGGG